MLEKWQRNIENTDSLNYLSVYLNKEVTYTVDYIVKFHDLVMPEFTFILHVIRGSG